jgi:aminoglycoside phosphotransferase (APT) family kinase protein
MAEPDLEAVAAFLSEALADPPRAPLRMTLLAGGRSNLTYLVSDGRRQVVLRRPPRGHVLETGHDMSREHRVLTALHRTRVPVAEPLALCADASVIGAPFYVMSYVAGTAYRETAQLAALLPAEQEAVADGLADVLAELHLVDPAAVGLAELGRPEGFLERQVRRWGTQLDASRSRELADLDALGSELRALLPTSRRGGIVHGDYRIDNTLTAADGRPAAILDWEMATLGDPWSDLGYLVMWWDGINDLPTPIAATPGEVAGFPSSARLLERYASRSGLDVGDLDWYVALAYYKTAVLFETIWYRHHLGGVADDELEALKNLPPVLAARGRDALPARPA